MAVIRKLTPKWNYVPGAINPAYIATRKLDPDALVETCWCRGPDFLKREECDWPQKIGTQDCATDPELTKELKKGTMVLINDSETLSPLYVDCVIDITKFSTFRRLVNVTALVFRFKTRVPQRAEGTQISSTYPKNLCTPY